MKKRRNVVNDWLYLAGEDLQAARLLLQEAIFSLACFHAQQCVEKSFKALLVFYGVNFKKLHDLNVLYSRCLSHGAESLKIYQKEIVALNLFYAPTRYPDAFPGTLPHRLPNKEDAQSAVQAADDIHQAALDLIKE